MKIRHPAQSRWMWYGRRWVSKGSRNGHRNENPLKSRHTIHYPRVDTLKSENTSEYGPFPRRWVSSTCVWHWVTNTRLRQWVTNTCVCDNESRTLVSVIESGTLVCDNESRTLVCDNESRTLVSAIESRKGLRIGIFGIPMQIGMRDQTQWISCLTIFFHFWKEMLDRVVCQFWFAFWLACRVSSSRKQPAVPYILEMHARTFNSRMHTRTIESHYTTSIYFAWDALFLYVILRERALWFVAFLRMHTRIVELHHTTSIY